MHSPSRPLRARGTWRRRALGIGLSAFVASASLGQASVADPLRLDQAVARALAQGAAARIARLEEHRAADAAGVQRGAYLPQLLFKSEAGWSSRFDETITVLDKDSDPIKLSLATLGTDRGWLNVYLTQILFDLRQWRLIEREELAAEAASAAAIGERDAVSHEVLRRYGNLLRLERKLTAANEWSAEAQWLEEQADALPPEDLAGVRVGAGDDPAVGPQE